MSAYLDAKPPKWKLVFFSAVGAATGSRMIWNDYISCKERG
jgi:hypothetical protein